MPQFRIPYLSVARANGEDAADFLQSQLSSDVKALAPGETGFGCYCTPKGQVLGLLLVTPVEDGFLLAAHSDLLPGLLQRLRMYVLRSKVTLEPADDLCVADGEGFTHTFEPTLPPMDNADAWRAGELRAGIAWLDRETSEKHIPQMLGYDRIGAVSFKKGCYPGQEIVARARYLGTVKRLPLTIETEGRVDARNGDRIRLRRGGEWSDAALVDHAFDGERTVLFTVARFDEDAGPVEEAGIGETVYRCATT